MKTCSRAAIRLFIALPILAFATAALPWSLISAAPPLEKTKQPITVEEARGRARLLHETIHATLQIVHHEYYREDEGIQIPAATLRRVFRELAERQQVELRWLAVNAQAMNTDHIPRDDFERQAVKAMSAGKDEYEQVDKGLYRLASTITLTSECLKCHSPTRSSNEARAAGLVIAIPLLKESPKKPSP